MPEILWRLVFVVRLYAPGLVEDFVSPLAQQLVRGPDTELARTAARAVNHGPHHPAAVERDDCGDELELIVAQRRGQGANRRLAAASERVHDAAFGVECLGRYSIRDGVHGTLHALITSPDFDRDDALPGCRHAGALAIRVDRRAW